MQAGLEIFERAADARGRLLRVEAERSGSVMSHLVLTFDIGRIGITPSDDGLVIRSFADASELPAGLEALDEEEPWWRLLGHPITAAWPETLGAVKLTLSRPSLFTADARMTARIGSPSSRASSSRLRAMMPSP